jgi:MoaA/NifB/PqqE/SkfB family radical SAM enzyme
MTVKTVLKQMRDLKHNKTPGQVVIQYTDHCNACCPQCGMRKTSRFKRHTLARETVRRTLRAAAERGAYVVSFTGGEPLLFLDELTDHLRYAGEMGLEYLRTGTNGFFFAGKNQGRQAAQVERVADALAATPLRNLWISLDSADPLTHEEMRGFPGLVDGIAQNLHHFHDRGIYPAANMGINRNTGGEATRSLLPENFSSETEYLEAFYHAYHQAFCRFFNLVVSLGFTMVNLCYPMSITEDEENQGLEAVYAATTHEDIVRFSRKEKAALFKALLDVIPDYRDQIRLFSPRSSLYALFRHYADRADISYPCRGGIDYFFIDAKDGKAYPCGYRGAESLGHLWNLKETGIDSKKACRLCDWECFRDPSQLLGPVLDLWHNPLKLMRTIKDERYAGKLWLEDLRYYKACGFFNGRKPPSHIKKINKAA